MNTTTRKQYIVSLRSSRESPCVMVASPTPSTSSVSSMTNVHRSPKAAMNSERAASRAISSCSCSCSIVDCLARVLAYYYFALGAFGYLFLHEAFSRLFLACLREVW